MSSIDRIFAFSAILVIAVLASTATPSMPVVPNPFEITFQPVTRDIVPGPIQLELIVKRTEYADTSAQLEITFETYDQMIYTGPRVIHPEFDESDSLYFTLQVTIVPDTVGGIKAVVSQGMHRTAGVFIKTYGDSVQVFRGILQERFRGRPVKRPERILGGWNEGEFPHLDSIYKPIWDSIAAEKQAFKDSVWQKYGVEERPDLAYLVTMDSAQQARHLMSLRESTPLTGKALETYRMGDSMFYRLEGQTEFRPLAGEFSVLPKVIESDSGRTVDPNQVVMAWVRVENEEQLRVVEQASDSAFQIVDESVYFLFLSRRNLRLLFEAGLRPDVNTDSPRQSDAMAG